MSIEDRVRIIRILVELGASGLASSAEIDKIANQAADQLSPAHLRQLARYATRAASIMETAANAAEKSNAA